MTNPSSPQFSTQSTDSFFKWLLTHWARAALLTAFVLIIFSPFLWISMGLLMLSFFQLPLYMIHQYEEHAHGAFKAMIIRNMGEGAVTDLDIAFINLVYVWVLFIICLYLSGFVHAGFGLVPIYFVLINAFMHIKGAVLKKAYNPGLWTAIALFVPIGSLCLYFYSTLLNPPVAAHVVSIALVVLIHAEIIVRLRKGWHFLGQ